MAEEGKSETPKRYPAVYQYGPHTVRGLKPGEKKKWCTCGLSKKDPWCDGAHKRTGFHSLKWIVPENPDASYDICGCKHTKNAPYCDGTCRERDLESEVKERQEKCLNKEKHPSCSKMCTSCGWVDF
ncbi:uncharacterized protein [Antedon mediterranea]|uniref:uncharacterized protein isoform X1 n=1 Tax=Antedon mediterranea TaxID=105859 RepID=UPI003AF6CA96